MKQRVFAALLALCCVLGLTAPAALAQEIGQGEITPEVPAQENERPTRTVHIASVEQLKALAAICSLDAASDGLLVSLDADLDLDGENFTLIPIFNGVFEGNGHRITGLYPGSDGSNQGLFRYLKSEAVVRDLHVSGALAPTIGREYVGGLAGSSAGKLINCSFTGSVSGLNYVGGLVGDNSGSILSCTAEGTVDGKRFTGGIAGHNTGLISECVNRASVNTAINEESFDLESLNTVATVPLAMLSAEDDNVVSDSGGIVGYSGGAVMNCVNRGAVGYQHFGYNVGGVAGRQAGYLTACENYGAVLGRKDVAGIVGQMEPYLALIDSTSLSDELVTLNAYMNAASDDLAAMASQMREAIDSAADYEALDLSGDYSGSIAPEGEPFPERESGGSILDDAGSIIGDDKIPEELDTERIARIADNLNSMGDELEAVFAAMSDSAGYLAGDLTLANNQFSRVLMLLSNAIGGSLNHEIFEDVSDRLTETDVEGRVSHSINFARVEGDSNVGGVVGAMGIEYEFDLEDTVAEQVGANGIINSTYDAMCVCSDNVNHGSVLAKKDRVGGIVGCSEMGTVLLSENYGAVESSEGGYVGGVAGYSEISVRSCYAMCDLTGSRYVGGITGYGTAICDCASMIELSGASAFFGAIAGWADLSGGEVRNNVFVSDTVGAVDGISYAEAASPVSYQELAALETIPEEFKALKLSFLADGSLVKRLSVAYGSSVTPDMIPEVPAKEGFTGAWEPFETENLRFGATIQAVYTPYLSAVATDETREDSPQSIVLLEGRFDDDVKLLLEPYAAGETTDESARVLESWQVTLLNLPEDGARDYTLRYQTPEPSDPLHRVLIQVLNEDGAWETVQTTDNGSYVGFAVEGSSPVFRAVEVRLLGQANGSPWLYGGAALLAAAAVILAVAVGRRKRH